MRKKRTKVLLPVLNCLINSLLFSSLYSCTHNEYEIDVEQTDIIFSVEDVMDSKGIGVTNDAGPDPLTSMAVFCASTEQNKLSNSSVFNWMYNAEVKRANKNSPWVITNPPLINTLANTKWAGSGYHTFFAFAPYSVEGVSYLPSVNTPGLPQLNYTVPDNYTDQIDLLYSHNTLINGKQMYVGSQFVSFGFQHALSKITFEAMKEDLIEDPVTITSIELTNLKKKGTLSYLMNPEFSAIKSVEWNLESDKVMYQIYPDMLLDITNKALLPAGESMFLMPQNLTSENKIIITYNQGSEIAKKREVNLSSVTPGSAWFLSKAYKYSITIKEGEVTIYGKISDWIGQSTDLFIPGSYLNVTNLNLVVNQGEFANIYYATDAFPVDGICSNGISLEHDTNARKFTFPDTAPKGNYVITINAGKLSRKVYIEIQ